MFANRMRLYLAGQDKVRPVPKQWLDQSFMRSFTGHAAFDETLVTGDGEIEAGFDVDPELLRSSFEQWLRGRKLISPGARLVLEACTR